MTTDREFTTADLANADRAVVSPGGGADAHGPADASHTQVTPAPERDGEREADAASTPLFPAEEAGQFREQWVRVQGRFVDEPREAVEQADHLVAELMQRLAAQFSDTRSELERRWDGQEDVSTEELRVAMTQYRSFFERLLQA